MRYVPILLCIFLCACLEAAPQDTASASDAVIVEYDKFKNQTVVRTPLYLSRQGFTDTFPVRLAYEAVERDGSVKIIRLYVVAIRTDWGFYHSAFGEDGYRFRFVEVDRGVDSAAGIVMS